MAASTKPTHTKGELDQRWQFWVDRGGTFTDIIAKAPDGQLHCKKLLSENPEAYSDAALAGIRYFLNLGADEMIPEDRIASVKMGTTVATNALLERKGTPTVLAITQGLGDSLEIGDQTRPDTFALNIKKQIPLYSSVIEIEERVDARGKILTTLNEAHARVSLQQRFDQGLRCVAIVLLHAYRFPEHEKRLAAIAKSIGYTQISVSHDISPLIKMIPRGETTVVDAYLNPTLRHYVDRVSQEINPSQKPGKLLFMQSSGGLVDAPQFRGRDAILSGPAGGVISAIETAKLAGFNKVIGFDMGGTSTDVCHYAGTDTEALERVYDTQVAGVKLRTPMLYVHTVAAGGGSLLEYKDGRFQVGPASAGANPGPLCYRRQGKLAVTDINVCLGKIQSDFFPAIFGPEQDQELDSAASHKAFQTIADAVNAEPANQNETVTKEHVAEGFLDIAIEHMAQAIKHISISRGYDIKHYALNCFGGAGGQHACLVAERLGIKTILIHPFSGLLSAYGMGLAKLRCEQQRTISEPLSEKTLRAIFELSADFKSENEASLKKQTTLPSARIEHQTSLLLRYHGTDTTFPVALGPHERIVNHFEQQHQQRFGFLSKDKTITVETLVVESSCSDNTHQEQSVEKTRCNKNTAIAAIEATRPMFSRGQWHNTPVYRLSALYHGFDLHGPCLIIEDNGTIAVEPGWTLELNPYGHVILKFQHSDDKTQDQRHDHIIDDTEHCDPVTLEIFNNQFMSIAEQMGIVLQNTSQSVNVRERLDFSCAIFDEQGDLIANAPHVPVHLGSMDFSVKCLLERQPNLKPGDAFIHNNPYAGGTHLPDITVITPIFSDDGSRLLFFVANRAHHEDIGGIAPGSMSPKATKIQEEGVLFDAVPLLRDGQLLEKDIRERLSKAEFPARNVEQNIADLKAQLAANQNGANELKTLIKQHSLTTVQAYMRHIQNNAEQAVRRIIQDLDDGSFRYRADNHIDIHVNVRIDRAKCQAIIDFSGTSAQVSGNFNAPIAISYAAVMYVFRCLVKDNIPLNAGCLKPITLIVPEGSLLNPRYPAAVVAGNVETSQLITNALFAALGKLGSSQGTMNNFTFGNERVQYYETICSGSPAGFGFHGCAAVHTHMTNTRMTDPEILESRYPVILEEFSIDRDSGGRGQFNAGDGITRRIRFNEAMQCSILSGHRTIEPYGLNGGEAGRIGTNTLIKNHGETRALGGCAHFEVEIDDVVEICTPTGGGIGRK